MIDEVLLAYLSERVPSKRSARNIGYNVSNLRKWWSGKRIADVTARNCRAYAATKTDSAAGADLKTLRAAIRYWHEEYGPLPLLPAVWRPPEPASRDRWLTKSEAAKLLRASRRTPHLARLILIGLHTGSRPGVVRALQWSWIDFERGIMHRRAAGEGERATKRRPPVRLNRRILGHLRRWRRLDGERVPWIVHYDGRQIDDPHTSWKRAVKAAGLHGRVTPHTLRHTRATWMMQAGVDPWQAAGFLGMTVRVLEAVYGHHHPDWQKDAAEI